MAQMQNFEIEIHKREGTEADGSPQNFVQFSHESGRDAKGQLRRQFYQLSVRPAYETGKGDQRGALYAIGQGVPQLVMDALRDDQVAALLKAHAEVTASTEAARAALTKGGKK